MIGRFKYMLLIGYINVRITIPWYKVRINESIGGCAVGHAVWWLRTRSIWWEPRTQSCWTPSTCGLTSRTTTTWTATTSSRARTKTTCQHSSSGQCHAACTGSGDALHRLQYRLSKSACCHLANKEELWPCYVNQLVVDGMEHKIPLFSCGRKIQTVRPHQNLRTKDTYLGCRLAPEMISLPEIGPSVNKEYLSQLQLYSMFRELPVISNAVVIITVCVKVANSTFLVTNKRTKWAELSRYYLCHCFVR